MGDLITNASNGFSSTTGFSVASVVEWTGDNLITLFIGSGLAVLYELRYWIVALVIIAGIVYFAYRAFRFFRN
jgi:threonine/homoserine/homoserine lactone efflux protein